ncbi:hypothetical protein Q5H92_21900 [Hymenobacter sp. M29]|uniref:Uncharacterized protein n=1 Tax=Hymenobacter mellowenesis TaxID=3063995 RepID=A0ABT9AI72_9BACT|nr:hypothetical protein [Hymenobacter sp. M29]MDO7849034.1 hypothetical protein [Hymenobacter sp. M29]
MTTAQYLGLAVSFLLLLLGIIGYFAKSMVEEFKASLKARAAAEQLQAGQIVELTTALKLQTTESSRLRSEMKSLLKAFTAFDRWIYGELQHGTFKTKPPTFNHVGDVPTPDAEAA